jgi:protein SCO1/2
MTSWLCLLIPLFSLLSFAQYHEEGTAAASSPPMSAAHVSIPNVKLIDQRGRTVYFRELVKDKLVVINTVFTTCSTICPTMGAHFELLQKLLDQRTREDVYLISISVDPLTDTPERLRDWSAKFHAGPRWTLLTGEKQDVEYLLSSLRFSVGGIKDHSPDLLIGDDAAGTWHLYPGAGLLKPDTILNMIPAPRGSSDDTRAARNYFTDVALIDQDGRKVRLFSDLIRGKVVVINSFFTSCRVSCPMMAATLSRIQDSLGDRLGRDAFIVSFTVDPEVDTPERLKLFASHMKARQGWEFVTGRPEDLQLALGKLGLAVAEPADHMNLIIIGNEPTGLWKKANGMAPANQVISIVASVLGDGR